MTDDHLQTLKSWHQEPTTAREVVEALADLWRDAAQSRVMREQDPHSDELQQALIRTSVLNFVVYASSYGVAERASAVMAHLSGSHPSRSIAVVAQPDDPSSSLGASLNAQCHPGAEGRPRLCVEQIDLTARGAMVEHLPSIVTQFLIHDLPTLLWWPGEPPLGAPLFTRMAAVCDRLIVDSSDFSDPERMLGALAEFAVAQAACTSMSDLNWDRLIDWREMLAQFFDTAALRSCLQQIRTVAIEYAFDPGGQRTSAQALLLAGWLGACLGWSLDRVTRTDAGAYAITMHAAAQPVQMQITSSAEHPGEPGSLVAVRLTAGDGDQTAVFTLQAAGDGEHGTTTVEPPGSPPVARTVRLAPASESALISEEMEAFGRERAYDDALQAAGLLARQISAATR